MAKKTFKIGGKTFKTGDEIYAGYPTAHILNFTRNRKTKKLRLGKAKHLLWGDWIQVRDYDYTSDKRLLKEIGAFSATDKRAAKSLTKDLIPVRSRGQNGFISPDDIVAKQLLEIIFVDVGQGDGALFITPDDRKYVVDAGDADNMYRYLKWRFAGFKKAHTDFDGLIVTHPDLDHYAGFKHLIDDPEVSAENIWHNGIVEQFGGTAAKQKTSKNVLLGTRKTTSGQSFLTGLIENKTQLKKLLSQKHRWIKKTSGRPKLYPDLLNEALKAKEKSGKLRFPNIEMLSTEHGEKHGSATYLPGLAPGNASGCTVQILGPVVEPESNGKPRLRTFDKEPKEATTSMDTGKTKNGHSVLLKLEYGGVNVLFGGDLNSSAEMFLLNHYTDLPVYDRGKISASDIIQAARPIFGVDVAKACHHGSADFTDVFLSCVNAVATVVSSGDEESHAHPRSDTLGALGRHGRGDRSLIFSTELSRSSKEFTFRDDSPWYKAGQLEAKAEVATDAKEKKRLLEQAAKLNERAKVRNVTSYGAINFRTDGEKVVVAYMLEKTSDSRRWDVYTLESKNGGPLYFVDEK